MYLQLLPLQYRIWKPTTYHVVTTSASNNGLIYLHLSVIPIYDTIFNVLSSHRHVLYYNITILLHITYFPLNITLYYILSLGHLLIRSCTLQKKNMVLIWYFSIFQNCFTEFIKIFVTTEITKLFVTFIEFYNLV